MPTGSNSTARQAGLPGLSFMIFNCTPIPADLQASRFFFTAFTVFRTTGRRHRRGPVQYRHGH